MPDSPLATQVLAPNATEFERAHLQAQFDAFDLDVDAIERESNPDTCHVDKLPFLALDKGLTVWSENWPEERKRSFVRDAWRYKVIEGSPAGIEAYINLGDGYVFDEVLPPARAFLVDDEDSLDHEAILSIMPQLRLYWHWPDREIPDAAMLTRDFVGESFAMVDDAQLLGRYPVIWDDGVVTPLGVGSVDLGPDSKTATLTRPGERGGALYVGEAFAGGASYFGPVGGFEHVVFDLEDSRMTRERDPVDALREQAFPTRGFVGDFFLTADLGDYGTFDRLYLSDPARIPTTTGLASGAAYVGRSWVGLPPYHMVLTVAMPGDPEFIPAPWQFVGEGYSISPDPERVASIMRLVEASRRSGDRVLIDLSPTSLGGSALPLPALD
jgi:hypothetical protein